MSAERSKILRGVKNWRKVNEIGEKKSLMVWFAPKDYFAAIAAVLQISAKTIYWSIYKTFGNHETFTVV